MAIDDYKKYAPAIVRIGISLVLLWFGLTNIFKPDYLLGYLPLSVAQLIPFAPTTFMMLNGAFEVIIGVLLLLGIFTRAAALLTALHIAGIAFSLGYNDIAVRDIGLAIAAFSVFVHGPDDWCMRKFK